VRKILLELKESANLLSSKAFMAQKACYVSVKSDKLKIPFAHTDGAAFNIKRGISTIEFMALVA